MCDSADLITHEVCPLCHSWGRVTWREFGGRRRFVRIDCRAGCGDYLGENGAAFFAAFPARPI